MDKSAIWLWLSLHFGAGSSVYQKLFEYFGEVEAIYDSTDADVVGIDFLNSSQKRKLLNKSLDQANEIIEWCNEHDVEIITPADDKYPLPFRTIENYPAAIYCVGKMPNFQMDVCISVVGTRKMSVYGQKNAYELGYGLAKGGAVVISGMALGIDCTAQKGALYAGGTTVAVLGSGIDVVYPRENLQLMQKIMKVGAVITEYPPHTPPNGSNFPVRNRLISALSIATVVVEADMNSGSLITAKCAARQGKDLFAFPGPVKNYLTAGTNQLLSEGAMVATSAIDVLERYLETHADSIDITASKEKPVLKHKAWNMSPLSDSYVNAESGVSQRPSTPNRMILDTEKPVRFDPVNLSEKERILFDKMQYGKAISLDMLADDEIDPSELSTIISMLEIAGAIQSIPGGYYIKK